MVGVCDLILAAELREVAECKPHPRRPTQTASETLYAAGPPGTDFYHDGRAAWRPSRAGRVRPARRGMAGWGVGHGEFNERAAVTMVVEGARPLQAIEHGEALHRRTAPGPRLVALGRDGPHLTFCPRHNRQGKPRSILHPEKQSVKWRALVAGCIASEAGTSTRATEKRPVRIG
jgi:hypothetical protein